MRKYMILGLFTLVLMIAIVPYQATATLHPTIIHSQMIPPPGYSLCMTLVLPSGWSLRALALRWNFDDGNRLTGKNLWTVHHAWDEIGSYTVSVSGLALISGVPKPFHFTAYGHISVDNPLIL